MGLIPIPQEEIARKISKVLKFRKRVKSKKQTHEDLIIEKTYKKLKSYVKNNKNISISELDALVTGMQRSVMALQKRKIKRKQNKLKRGKSRSK